jgi:ferric enterobactin receptor
MKKLFLLTTFLICSLQGFSQVTTSTGITIKDEFYNNRQLVEILGDLEAKTGAKFKYEPSILKGVYASYWFDNMSLEIGMKGLLKGSGLKFYVDDNQVVNIIPKSQKVYVKSSYNSGTYYGGNASDVPAIAAPTVPNTPSTGVAPIQTERPKIAVINNRQVVKSPTKYNFTFTGRIIDTRTSEPLPFVNISIRSNKSGTQGNVDGYFTLLKVPSDTTTLVLSYIGYITTTIKLVPDAPINGVTIEMEPDNAELDEVVVKNDASKYR